MGRLKPAHIDSNTLSFSCQLLIYDELFHVLCLALSYPLFHIYIYDDYLRVVYEVVITSLD